MAYVAPYMGAWIEISPLDTNYMHKMLSRPTWARGLKLFLLASKTLSQAVAPYMGAWIEIFPIFLTISLVNSGRALHGRVD